MTVEVWGDIPGWEGYYAASTWGRIRSLDRVVARSDGTSSRQRGKILKTFLTSDKTHLQVQLFRNGRHKGHRVHTLIAATFIGEPPPGMEVCHIDDNGFDNRVGNLRYGTHSSNMIDRVKNGHDFNAKKTHCPSRHEYSLENTYVSTGANGRTMRHCRECTRARGQARTRAQKLARRARRESAVAA